MLKILLSLGVFITPQLESDVLISTSTQSQETPAYAKWGKMAFKETQSNYPNAQIIDYHYQGTFTQADITIEQFKFWLKEDLKEFGVLVKIKYATDSEKVISIQLDVTPR